MRRTLPLIAAAVTAASLGVTSSALARAGDRTVDETYPVATAVCVKAHAGTLPPKLVGQQTAVLSACDTLENAFPPLVATVDAAEAQYLSVVSTQKGLASAACTRPVSDHAACVQARLSAHSAVIAAHGTARDAVVAFHTAVEANRNTFWSTLQSLRTAS